MGMIATSLRADMEKHMNEVKKMLASVRADLEGQIGELGNSMTESIRENGEAIKADVKRETSRAMHAQLRLVSNELNRFRPGG
jgi:predicted phage gp36 major capsid-like protein